MKCLFPPPPKLERKHGVRWREEMICRTSKSRHTALKLLAELADGCPENLGELLALIFAFHEKSVSVPLEIAKPAEKNLSGYVGLRNPGCICYMNSFLQQLYMTPTLRYGIMAAQVSPYQHLPRAALTLCIKISQEGDKDKGKDQDKGKGKEEDKPVDLSENLLYQLQRMFGHLLHSEVQFYDPSTTFCKVSTPGIGLVCLTGLCVHTGVQGLGRKPSQLDEAGGRVRVRV